MNDKENIINSIFFPRNSVKPQDSLDTFVLLSDGVSIGARLFLVNSEFDNIIFFHGNGEIACEYDDIAKIYNQHNFNLIVIDYRGYGLSKGVPTKENLLSDAVESFDCFLKILKNKGYNKKVVIMGRSLGSASAAQIISKKEDCIDGCIIESGFATEYDLFKLVGLDYKKVGFELEDGFESLRKIENYKSPLLIIHARQDHIVPLEQGVLMHDSSKSANKNIFIVEGANHNDIMYRAGINYFKKIRSFVDSI
ncbi:MAG: alpha/beta hydrolase [Candidatus Marinimicrobia bacterium]|nr:alpha/beta hydrolase [Candidatus Neomarinimicrobiota bacterium]|tara:strand:- start:5989 stop:6744 length:756 start_codon:yes stop_codon:yes gene_type:complete